MNEETANQPELPVRVRFVTYIKRYRENEVGPRRSMKNQ